MTDYKPETGVNGFRAAVKICRFADEIQRHKNEEVSLFPFQVSVEKKRGTKCWFWKHLTIHMPVESKFSPSSACIRIAFVLQHESVFGSLFCVPTSYLVLLKFTIVIVKKKKKQEKK